MFKRARPYARRALVVALLIVLSCGRLATAGWTDEEVKVLQERLRENAFYAGPISGVFDRATELALKRATSGFPELRKMPEDKRVYFSRQILSWYNNAFELKKADAQDLSGYLRVIDAELPSGLFRYKVREDGSFRHIEHVYELEIGRERRLVFSEQFINDTNPQAYAKASMSGRYRLGRWAGRDTDTLFLYVQRTSGSVWTSDDLRRLARRAGARNLPISLSVRLLNRDIVIVNGDQYSRVK